MRLFLKAEWRKLIMINYAIDPEPLKKYLPFNTELDFLEDRCYVTLVGFMFLDTRVRGLRIPFHTDFEEVNLRFYVRRYDNNQLKRGVVFIKEIVPRRALSLIANLIYKENYVTLKMGHEWNLSENDIEVSYRWNKGCEHHISVKAESTAVAIQEGSEEEFITEHYWGYTKRSPKITSEYEVKHCRWEHYPVNDYSIDVDFERNYGEEFACLNSMTPASVFLAEGSEVTVHHCRLLKEQS